MAPRVLIALVAALTARSVNASPWFRRAIPMPAQEQRATTGVLTTAADSPVVETSVTQTITVTSKIDCTKSGTTVTNEVTRTQFVTVMTPYCASTAVTTTTETLEPGEPGYTSTGSGSDTITITIGEPRPTSSTATVIISEGPSATSTTTLSNELTLSTAIVIISEGPSATSTITLSNTRANRVETTTITSTIPYNEPSYTSTQSGDTVTIIVGTPSSSPAFSPQTTWTITLGIPYSQPGYTTTLSGKDTVTVIVGSPSPSPETTHGLTTTSQEPSNPETTFTTTTLPYYEPGFTSTGSGKDTVTNVIGTPSQAPETSHGLTTTPVKSIGSITVTTTIPYSETGYTSTGHGKDTVTVIIGTPAPSPSKGNSEPGTTGTTKTSQPGKTGSATTCVPTGDANCPTDSTTAPSSPTSTNTSVATPSNCPSGDPKNPWIPCGVLNHKGNTFYLRTHVIYGNQSFENLYVQDLPANSASTVPFLSTNRDNAAKSYYDSTSSSVAISQGSCNFAGFVMVQDRDMNAWSPVFISNQVGSSVMSIANGELWWENPRFGSWLACRTSNGAVTLSWWDTITTQGIDADKCAKVQLLTENL